MPENHDRNDPNPLHVWCGSCDRKVHHNHTSKTAQAHLRKQLKADGWQFAAGSWYCWHCVAMPG